MARARFDLHCEDTNGNSIINAKVNVYTVGTTTAVTDLFTAASGGSPVTFLTSGADGMVTGYLTAAKDVDLNVTDNGGAAVIAGITGTRNFTAYTKTRAVYPPANDLAPPAAADAVLYVSTSGDDSKDGLTQKTAKLTIAAAIAALPSNIGRVEVGGGTFAPASGISIGSFVHVQGRGREITYLAPTGTGAAVTFAGSEASLDGMSITPTSTAATVKGVYIGPGCFANLVGEDTRLYPSGGVITTGQIGVHFDGTNTGCYWNEVAAEVNFWDTTVKFSGNATNQANANKVRSRRIGNFNLGLDFVYGNENVIDGVNLDAFANGTGFRVRATSNGASNLIFCRGEGGAGSTLYQIDAGASSPVLIVQDNCANLPVDNSTPGAVVLSSRGLGDIDKLFAGHFHGRGATPTKTLQAGAGSTSTGSVAGTDSAGQIIVTAGGAGLAAGALVLINFAATYDAAPNGVVITPGNLNSFNLGGFVPYPAATTGFYISVANAPAAGISYEWNWVVIR